ncbi:aKG-HExxH-type peptide beta-hydroxylase [Streptomyces acidicola]|uniref:aKG-HExxH-type peptide beta-hydroxylase n=1 Tax=Streptomyces acidicola TaxID=2596892 RepID=UPI00342F9F00
MTDDRRATAPARTLPPGLWRQIARGTPDPGTLGLLRRARVSRNLLLLRALHRRLRHEPDWGPGIALLTTVRHHAPAVFDQLIADPATGCVLAEAVRSGRPGAVPVLAAVAAHRTGIPFRLQVPVADGALVLPGLGRATVGPDAEVVRIERGPHGTTVGTAAGPRTVVPVPDVPDVPDVPGAAAPGWEPVPRLPLTAHGARFTVRLDPHTRLHPGAPGLLAPPTQARWRERLGAAWELLASRHTDRAQAVSGTVRVVVPLDRVPHGTGAHGSWHSASFSDAFGLVALAPLDDPAELAAALVHETQHSLLYALQDLTRLLDAVPGARGHAPWSDRPRPPSALLQGAAAFLVTAGFWRTEAAWGSRGAAGPYDRWRRTARTAGDELARGGWLTVNGTRLLDAMQDVLAEWEEQPVQHST